MITTAEKTNEKRKQPAFKQVTVLIAITLFQLLSASSILLRQETVTVRMLIVFFGYIAFEWLYMLVGTAATGTDYFELESIAFFLCGISLVMCAGQSESKAFNQFLFILLGVVVYLAMLFILRNIDIAIKLRYPVAIASLLALAANLVIARLQGNINGAYNWIRIGSGSSAISLQPSELVKVVFILVGAVTLEYLISNQSLILYIGYCMACIGALFLMKDFGTALIFFFTFMLLAYMRSGDIRTLAFICTGALLAGLMALSFSDTIANRFANFRHVLDDEFINKGGYQQSRALIYMASGGFLGLGVGKGEMRKVYAADTDFVFSLVCEEMGLIVGIMILLCFVGITLYALRCARQAGSSFYAIAATAAAGLLLFQLALNVFGETDILPLTGVTVPFVSRGGSSMLSCWGLLAYIRCAGTEFKPPQVKRAVPISTPRRRQGGNAR